MGARKGVLRTDKSGLPLCSGEVHQRHNITHTPLADEPRSTRPAMFVFTLATSGGQDATPLVTSPPALSEDGSPRGHVHGSLADEVLFDYPKSPALPFWTPREDEEEEAASSRTWARTCSLASVDDGGTPVLHPFRTEVADLEGANYSAHGTLMLPPGCCQDRLFGLMNFLVSLWRDVQHTVCGK
jgi:hypothetical protein